MAEFRDPAYLDDEEGTTLDIEQQIIEKEANEMGIPVAFSRDRIKSGGLFNKVVDDCLVIYNPEHKKDYFHFCVYLSRQGKRTYIYTKLFGKSKQMDKFDRAEAARQDRQGKELAYQLGSAVGSGLRNLGRSKRKLQDEQQYYAILGDVFDKAFS